MTETVADAAIDAAAARLVDAATTRRACAAVRDLIGATDVAAAYRVQQRIVAGRLAGGARIVGRKIGLTAPAVQEQLGVDQPDFGVLFDDMWVADGDRVPAGLLIQPKVEAEVAFVLAADLTGDDLGPVQVRGAVEYAAPAIEIVDSRVSGWDITITDTVADNASSGLFVLGGRRYRLDEVEPADVAMTLTRNGEQVSSGNGRACLGDPLAALAWLARTACDFGSPLRRGDVVLSGALGPMVAVEPGDTVVAQLSGMGVVGVGFARMG